MSTLIDSQGKQVKLAEEIGRGGEAVVFNVHGRDDLLAKVYLPGKGNDGAKISAMLAIPDQRLRRLGAWPTDTLRDAGKITGFLMPKLTAHRPVYDLYVPKLRLQEFPKADWRFLVRVAENMARAFDFIHQAGVVIGDVNPSNLLVTNDATVRCIDCDSFQITVGGQRWLCRVGTGDYQPPEMQGMNSYQGVIRTSNHDNFGLAVMIFRLLFAGRHPYSGRYKGQGDSPSIEDAIRAFRYSYSKRRHTGMNPPGNALAIEALPNSIRDMLELAFDPGTTYGGRPTAESWMKALQTLGHNVRQCGVNPSHWFYSKVTRCPWCDIEQSGAVIFGAATPLPASHQRPSGQPGQPRQAAPTAQGITPLKVGLGLVGGLILFGWVASLGSSNKATLPTQPVPVPPHVASPPPPTNQPSAPLAVQGVPLASPPAQYQPAPPAKFALTPTPVPSTVASHFSVPSPVLPPSTFAVPPPTQVWPQQPSWPAQPTMTIGPSYDCVKTETPLAKFICLDAELSRVDVEMMQPYYVLRHLVAKDGWKALLYEAIDFQDQTAYDCKIDSGALPENLNMLKACLILAYKSQREVWWHKLQGAGREEASRPIEQHIALQAKLQTLGFLPATAKIDGVYGTATRDAIIAWQTASQLPSTGLLGTSDAIVLSQSKLVATKPIETPSFTEGQRDRQAWETWFSATTGDYRRGASWWAGHRNLPRPGSCFALTGDARTGCSAATNYLSASDVRRRVDPNYRRGWNSY